MRSVRPRSLRPGASDEVLVEAIRNGDEPAVVQMVERYRDRLFSYCARILRSREDAEDVVQQTLISAIEALKRSEEAIALKPWLYRIAHNNSISAMRKRSPVPDVDVNDVELPAASTVGADAERREELREMLRSLERLPDEQRSALVLSELEDMSGNQIGETLGCEPQRVRNLIYQARQAMLADRDATEMECREVRRTLASWSGRPDKLLGRHLDLCDGCRGYRERVRRQRTALASILPVPPGKAFAADTYSALGIEKVSSPLAGAGSRSIATLAVAVLALVVIFSGRLDDGSATEVPDTQRAEGNASSAKEEGDRREPRDRGSWDDPLAGDATVLTSGGGGGPSRKNPGAGGKPEPSPGPAPTPAPPAPAPPPTSPSGTPAPPPDPPCIPPSCIP
jgi:RNA polymerase sigma factor (sigma-70 family)